MTSISSTITATGAAAVFPDEVAMVIVHDGTRGPVGPEGPDGPDGATGPGIVVLGPWAGGQTYCPGDGVTSRSSADAGIQSLWVQRSSQVCEVSTVEPYLDLSRWSEIGATDLSNITGAIWTVYQLNHGFQYVGTPACFSMATAQWEQASNRNDGVFAVALVREVISADLVVLQTTGEIPNLDPRVIFPAATTWALGSLYYTSSQLGRLTTSPPNPTDANTQNQPILIATKFHSTQQPSESYGVVLPWRPAPTKIGVTFVEPVKFYYEAVQGQTVLDGLDLDGNPLTYVPGSGTDVFLNGLNLSSRNQFSATDGVSIEIAFPMQAGDDVEIWTTSASLAPILPSTVISVDNLQSQFDGVTTTFFLTFNGGTELGVFTAPQIFVYLDGSPQQPDVNYTILPKELVLNTRIVFAVAPDADTRFWGVAATIVP